MAISTKFLKALWAHGRISKESRGKGSVIESEVERRGERAASDESAKGACSMGRLHLLFSLFVMLFIMARLT